MPTSQPLPTIPCCECNATLTLGVQKSAAGYFLGFSCDECGPHSRVSAYTKDHAKAAAVLEETRNPDKWAIWQMWASDNL